MARTHLSPPILVDDQAGLEEMLARLDGVKAVGLDCEMDSFYSYWGKVCLIQISDRKTEWIVDPLSVDVRPLGPLLADGSCTKILHDAEYDVRQLKADYGFSFAGIFDTRAACAALGVAAPGLASVLQARFGVKLSKRHQRADWTRRPIPKGMLAYAQLDVAHLHDLRDELTAELAERDRQVILDSEHARIEALDAAGDPYDDENYARIKGAARLDGEQRRRLRELYIARNRVARKGDRAPFRVLGNPALLSMALRPPDSIDAMVRHDGVTTRALRRVGEPLRRALKRASELEPIDHHAPRRNGVGLRDEALDRYEALRSWRSKRAETDGIDSALVLRKETMITLASETPDSLDQLAQHLAPWQVERLGNEILETLAKAKPHRRRR